MVKRTLGTGVALLVALGIGWVWGASGRLDISRSLELAELRHGLLEGRSAVLEARLDIYSVNFGEASRHLEMARSALRAADARLNDLGRQEDATRLKIALTRIDDPLTAAFGSKIFTPPAARADAAIAPRRPYRTSPGHAVNPVSR